MIAFQQTIEHCELSDLGYQGPKFTWKNCRDGMDFIKERLDRGLANIEWRNLFLLAEVIVDMVTGSDHTPLLLCLTEANGGRRGQFRFRYEKKWRLDEGSKDVLREAWVQPLDEGNRWEKFKTKIDRCQHGLLRWQKNQHGPMQENILHLQRRLHELQEGEEERNWEELNVVQSELQLLLDKDLKWQQRAKSEWLKSGDRNTRFYHACANLRRKSNRISSITNAEGVHCSSPDEVKMTFINYFVGFFTTDSAGDMESWLQSLEHRVSEEMNSSLLKPFSVEEIRTAFHSMAPLKAPGPDGFPAGFIQANWDIMGDDICLAILSTLNLSIMPHFLNLTNIALIPKLKNPTCVTEFRPISLCNVTYKLISKVLANRLKKIMPYIISPVQSAFIPR